MRPTGRRGVLAVTAGVAVLGTSAAVALGSVGSGFTPDPPFVTASLDEGAHVHGDGIRFRAHGPVSVRVQKVTISAGGYSGWHHHPGMVIGSIASGSVTITQSDCSSKTYGPGLPNGSAFLEGGDDNPMQASSTDGAVEYVTYIAPEVNPPVFRIEDNPPACAVPPS